MSPETQKLLLTMSPFFCIIVLVMIYALWDIWRSDKTCRAKLAKRRSEAEEISGKTRAYEAKHADESRPNYVDLMKLSGLDNDASTFTFYTSTKETVRKNKKKIRRISKRCAQIHSCARNRRGYQ